MLGGSREKIAVIGGGAAGLGAAWRLSEKYDVTVYEADAELGGHAYGHPFAGTFVDMGVMITLPWAYPNLYCMFQRYGVRTRAAAATLMVSFSGPGGSEEIWGNDASLQGTALFSRLEAGASRFEQMMFEIAALPMKVQMEPISRFIDRRVPGVPHSGGYDEEFVVKGLCPLLSLFLVTRNSLLRTPAWSLSMMFRYGTLSFFSPTTWRTVVGGSRRYIARLTRSFRARYLLGTRVTRVLRSGEAVTVTDDKKLEERYDQVVFATSADQALSILAEPSDDECRLLGAFRHQPAVAYLHQDSSLLSREFDERLFFQYRSASAAPCPDLDGVMTYNMKRVSDLDRVSGPVLVSVFSSAPEAPPAGTVVRRDFSHFIPDDMAMKARLGLNTLQGVRRSWFCGDYTTFSSHEDAFVSGMVISEALGVDYPFRDHPAAAFRYNQNRLLMLPPLGARTRLGVVARSELLRDSLDVVLPALRRQTRPQGA